MRYEPMEEQLTGLNPVVEVVPYNVHFRDRLHDQVTDQELILEYPTVYLIYDEKAATKQQAPKFIVYVGETSDIERRTQEHLGIDAKQRADWLALKQSGNAQMMVVGNRYFNKSLTLDIENRLMLYLMSVKNVKRLDNRRFNPQRKYFMSDYSDEIFNRIWQALRRKRADIFEDQSEIENTAIFKASPFHNLNYEQNESKVKILGKVENALAARRSEADNQDATVIFIAGQAGTGKTVLLSNLFYDLTGSPLVRPKQLYLLVNHEQQVKVYQAIARKLGLDTDVKDIVSRPTHFINTHQGQPKVDVVLVDEAHLLWTQGKQSYRGENQLQDLLKLAKVVIIVFDKYQILTTQEYLDDAAVRKLEDGAESQGNRIELVNQERMVANQATIDWIRTLIVERTVGQIPADDCYQLKVARSPEQLYRRVQRLDQQRAQGQASLVRMLATFDWPYSGGKAKPKNGPYWEVKIGEWHLPWNLELPAVEGQERQNKLLAWAEQPQTVGEVGSTFTIQGFDLNYAAVIIGPSVKYRDGHIVFDASASKNRNPEKDVERSANRCCGRTIAQRIERVSDPWRSRPVRLRGRRSFTGKVIGSSGDAPYLGG